jgi:hypothetical protein
MLAGNTKLGVIIPEKAAVTAISRESALPEELLHNLADQAGGERFGGIDRR